MTSPEVPRVLCDTAALIAGVGSGSSSSSPAPGSGSGAAAGALWRLAEPGRQLDSNVVRLPPGERVDTHAEPDLDVLLLVLSGGGTVTTVEGTLEVNPGTLLWLPRTSSRALAAGADGLCYLTVHRRRPGLQIRRP